MAQHFVYITASRRNGTLYIGKASDLARRMEEHKNHVVKGFTDKYDVTNLVYYEACDSHDAALCRERQLKEWKRAWKLELIEKFNPTWKDLCNDLVI